MKICTHHSYKIRFIHVYVKYRLCTQYVMILKLINMCSNVINH